MTYYFAVTALAPDGLESAPSREVTYTIPSGLAQSPLWTEVVISPVASKPTSTPAQTDQILHTETEVQLPDGWTPIETPGLGPKLDIIPIGQPATALRIAFDSPTDAFCDIQVTSDLQNWSSLLSFVTGPEAERLEYVDPIVDTQMRFYRLFVIQ